MARIQVDEKIKIAFNFNNSDLQDNRQGFMSFRQKRKLRILSFLKFDWIFATIVAMAIIICPITTLMFSKFVFEPTLMNTTLEKVILLLPIVLLLLGCVAILFIICMRTVEHWAKFNSDIRSGQVNSIQLQIDSRRRSGFWFLGGEACIKLTPEQLFALQDNYIYRMYYAPNTCEILSVEIVRVDRGPRDKV